jgi:hypothetical protein
MKFKMELVSSHLCTIHTLGGRKVLVLLLFYSPNIWITETITLLLSFNMLAPGQGFVGKNCLPTFARW